MNEQYERISGWAPIVGHWTFEEPGTATYTGPQPQRPIPFGICVSQVRFTEGEVGVTVRLPRAESGVAPEASGRILLGYRSPTDEYLVAGLGGYGFAYTITHFDPARGWRGIALAGSHDNLNPEHRYKLTVRVRGQRLMLEVDGIRVLEHLLEAPLTYGQLGLFAWGNCPVEFSEAVVTKERGTIFVVMQFSGPYEELYTDVIRPVADQFGLRVYHAGEVFGPGIVLEDIVRGIVDAKIVIAEITPPNPNVFYELGYAHALRKPTILLAEKGKQLPFDVSGYRCLFYENSIGGKRKVEEGLRKHLQAILHE
ncbi:MAG TPA: hypothetical protein VNL14_00735 [Candidatus Acidoferrales bacterium]|nr:hypothetical protein [Candidatus Acidoferrales bacterium]